MLSHFHYHEFTRSNQSDARFFLIRSLFIRFLQPICLGRLVAYFAPTKHQKYTLLEAYAYATGIVLSTIFMVCGYNPYAFYALNVANKIRAACSGLIYQKSLKILKCSAEEGLNGKIINILTSDMARFDTVLAVFPNLWVGPCHTVLFLVVIYMEIGVSGIIGIACLFAYAPMQGNGKIITQ